MKIRSIEGIKALVDIAKTAELNVLEVGDIKIVFQQDIPVMPIEYAKMESEEIVPPWRIGDDQ